MTIRLLDKVRNAGENRKFHLESRGDSMGDLFSILYRAIDDRRCKGIARGNDEKEYAQCQEY